MLKVSFCFLLLLTTGCPGVWETSYMGEKDKDNTWWWFLDDR